MDRERHQQIVVIAVVTISVAIGVLVDQLFGHGGVGALGVVIGILVRDKLRREGS